jgi:hypothetical protein
MLLSLLQADCIEIHLQDRECLAIMVPANASLLMTADRYNTYMWMTAYHECGNAGHSPCMVFVMAH